MVKTEVKKENDIHTTNESRPFEALMLSRMTVVNVVTHILPFFIFVAVIVVFTTIETSTVLSKLAILLGIILAATGSFYPWLRDLLRR